MKEKARASKNLQGEKSKKKETNRTETFALNCTEDEDLSIDRLISSFTLP